MHFLQKNNEFPKHKGLDLQSDEPANKQIKNIKMIATLCHRVDHCVLLKSCTANILFVRITAMKLCLTINCRFYSHTLLSE